MAALSMVVLANDDVLNEGMNEDQIEALFDKLKAEFLERRFEIPQAVAQLGLAADGLGHKMFTTFRHLAESSANLTVRTVRVDRSRSPQKSIHDIGCAASIDHKVVGTMPQRKGEVVELVYFRPNLVVLGSKFSPAAVAEEYEKRGLLPDPRAQIDHNASDSAFAAEMPNVSQWQDEYGNYFFSMFTNQGGHSRLLIHRSDSSYDSSLWFAGVKKEY